MESADGPACAGAIVITLSVAQMSNAGRSKASMNSAKYAVNARNP
jgi:hypothetical protein